MKTLLFLVGLFVCNLSSAQTVAWQCPYIAPPPFTGAYIQEIYPDGIGGAVAILEQAKSDGEGYVFLWISRVGKVIATQEVGNSTRFSRVKPRSVLLKIDNSPLKFQKFTMKGDKVIPSLATTLAGEQTEEAFVRYQGSPDTTGFFTYATAGSTLTIKRWKY